MSTGRGGWIIGGAMAVVEATATSGAVRAFSELRQADVPSAADKSANPGVDVTRGLD